MVYLDPGDYVRFGLEEDTSDGLVAAASALIDAFCRRATLGVTTFVERLRVGRYAGTLRLSYGPVVAVMACRVRMRRPSACTPLTPLQADALVFGLSGAWTDVDPTAVAVAANGEAELPGSAFGLPADEAEITYSAGYATVPDAVKIACAQVVRNAQSTPGLNVKRQQVDALEMEYFSNSLIDDSVQRLLQPYLAGRLG